MILEPILFFSFHWSSIFFFFRYQFFLQVKEDILQGRLPVSQELAIELAALALQCEFSIKVKVKVMYRRSNK
jgi:hypothetical protein